MKKTFVLLNVCDIFILFLVTFVFSFVFRMAHVSFNVMFLILDFH